MKAAVAAVQTRFKNVLFATDFSDAAARAIPYIREIAKHYDTDLLTLHVRPPCVNSMHYRPTSPTNTADAKIEDKQLRQEILAAFHGIRTKVQIEEGNIDNCFQSALRMNNVDLVVVGTTGQTTNGKHRLWSVAEGIFRTVTCPVLTVGPHSRPDPSGAPLRKILCATDQTLEDAVAHAVSLSHEFQSRLVLLNVISEQEAGYHVPSSDVVASSKHLLHNLLPPDAESWCKPEYIISYGDVADAILEIERKTNPNLIVLGARLERGIHGAAANLPIAAAQSVVARATCPVLTVRG
jgi:nucleotide-binding universal stress UspA family protein